MCRGNKKVMDKLRAIKNEISFEKKYIYNVKITFTVKTSKKYDS